jgi:8-oxo-dGTP pyrophosphatase MutT (NUDIX family)
VNGAFPGPDSFRDFILVMSRWRELLLEAVSPLEYGVRDLDVTGYRPAGDESFRPSRTAAVLVPLLDLPEPQIVFTRRADHLPQHPGQVSFPGGAAEENDSSAVQTALREAYEEIGLPPEAVRPIGFLDRMDTISDYRVLPVVALVTPPVIWNPDAREVAEVFTVPLAIVLDIERYESRIFVRHGQEHPIYTLHWQGYTIWGATAAMLLNLTSRMQIRHEQRNPGISSASR